MIARIATIAFALCCCAVAGASRPLDQQLRGPKQIAKARPRSLAKPDAVRVTDIEPNTVNSTKWLVAYQFDDNACSDQPISGAKLVTGKCQLEQERYDEFTSFKYVCDHDLGAGMLTYNSTNCEPDTFLGFVELASSSGLEQCIPASYSDVPGVVDYLDTYVDGQIWQCSNSDSIGYDLSDQPTKTQYDNDCKTGLRAIGYFRKQECFATDEEWGRRSFSVTCNKKKFKANHYTDTTCTDSTWVDQESVTTCSYMFTWPSTDEWTEVVACTPDEKPDTDDEPGSDDDAAMTTSAGSLWMLASLLLLAGIMV